MAKQAKKKSAKKTPKAAKSKRKSASSVLRKVTRPAGKLAASSLRVATRLEASATMLTNHIYEVATVPSGCTEWAIGDYMEVPVGEPPPATVTITMSGPCSGLTANFVE